MKLKFDIDSLNQLPEELFLVQYEEIWSQGVSGLVCDPGKNDNIIIVSKFNYNNVKHAACCLGALWDNHGKNQGPKYFVELVVSSSHPVNFTVIFKNSPLDLISDSFQKISKEDVKGFDLM